LRREAVVIAAKHRAIVTTRGGKKLVQWHSFPTVRMSCRESRTTNAQTSRAGREGDRCPDERAGQGARQTPSRREAKRSHRLIQILRGLSQQTMASRQRRAATGQRWSLKVHQGELAYETRDGV
jgi:hypothetical protein